jgi:hypothetical protein
MATVTATLAQVLGRLGAGQTLRLRRSGPAGTVEVHARGDGALEVPAAVLASSVDATEAVEPGPEGPHVIYGRHRVEELATQLVAAIEDLELVTSSIVDASGVERLLDGSGARSDVTVDGHLDRWDLPLIEQVRRYLSQRFNVALSELVQSLPDILFVPLGRLPHIVQTLDHPPRIRVAAPIVQGLPAGDRLDLTLHRLNAGDGLVRLRHHWNKVLAEVVLPAPTFMGQHLDLAFSEIGRISLDVSDAIAKEFGGDASYRMRYSPKLSDAIDPDGPTHPTDPSDRSATDDSEEEDR